MTQMHFYGTIRDVPKDYISAIDALSQLLTLDAHKVFKIINLSSFNTQEVWIWQHLIDWV